MKKLTILFIAITLSLLLTACGGEEEQEQTTDPGTEESPEQGTDEGAEEPAPAVDDSETVDENEVVATVNGEEISGQEYNMMYAQTKMMLQQYGQTESDSEQLKEQTLNELINQKLIQQDAKEKGIEVPTEEVDSNIEQIKSQYETDEQFEETLASLQLTEDSLRAQISFEVLLQEYLEQTVTDVEVTDQEVEEYYEQIASQGGEDVPELDEVRDQIEEELLNQQKQSKIGEIAEQLREEGSVETLI
ncbi:SurA N-terminal domain-containing protein [Aquibacillus albus]|uniref:peptidylprolyl isomerase n=1 Tax=Aquibacillus albus TaxID=1168171 RepID=A0ABS2MWK1_9BACI|nr:SurA N-terminal domain-containing protein [Aquibacillus albus]MBM7570277.1 FKBP-type peptidyl-prolyl cis-trans isomerase (trigger factor) [Aquibacillus albus]